MAMPTLKTTPCGTAPEARIEPQPTGSGSFQDVTTTGELDTYLGTGGTPGDVVRISPSVDYASNSLVIDLVGTAADKIIFTSSSLTDTWKVTGLGETTEASNFYGIRLTDAEYVEIWGVEVSDIGNWGIVGGMAYQGDATATADHCAVRYSYIHNCGQEGVRVSNSAFFETTQNEIHDTGALAVASPGSPGAVGECIYYGQGSSLTHFSNTNTTDVLIHQNYCHDNNFGEGIEVKTGMKRIVITENWLDTIHVDSDGGITVLINDGFDYGGADPEVYVARNVCWGTVQGQYGGSGISCGQDFGITLESNLLFGCAQDGLQQNLGTGLGPATDVGGGATISRNNTSYGNAANAYDAGTGWTKTDNLADDATGTSQVVSGDFVGPLTGDYDAGDGPGSGLRLTPGNSLLTSGSGATLTDACGKAFALEEGALSDYAANSPTSSLLLLL